MTAIQNAIPVSAGRALTPPTVDLSKENPELVAASKKALDAIRNGPSAAEMAAQIAKQAAVEADTVFRVAGKIVAVQWQDGSTLFPGAPVDGGANARGREMAAQQGLDGADANATIVREMTEALRQRYGSALTIDTFGASSGPTRAQLYPEMFGRPYDSGASLRAVTEPVTYNSDVLVNIQSKNGD